tara:strand:+ start:6958 stop:7638 length:681 start_codon:yes stop_codon:yes gene_type:complete
MNTNQNILTIDLDVVNEMDNLKIDNLNTGDMILCHCQKDGKLDPGIDGIIEEFTHSPYEHAAMIIKNPPWLDEGGIYVLQSGTGPNGYPDVMNGNKCGVTFNRFEDFICNRHYVCVRNIEGVEWNEKTWAILKSAFDECHGKPYDSNLCHWFCVGISSFFCCPCWGRCCLKREKYSFWCSALVAFIYVKMGWLPKNLDWSDKTPGDLSIIELEHPAKLGNVWIIKK